MRPLPPALKRFLEAIGVNTVRLEWKLRYWRQQWRWEKTPFARWAKTLSYPHKFCACGQLVDKDAKVCPVCGRELRSRALYRLGRLLGFATPEVGVVWPALLFVIVAVFVLEVRLGGLASLLNPPGELLVRLGALYTPAIMSGEYWRLLSAGLLHVGVLHIVFNLMALSQLAPAIEEEIGASRFMVLATVTQLGCTLASYSLRAFAFSAGASGIAFGLIGFGLAYSRRQRTSHGRMLSDIYLKWAVYGFFFGMMIGADNLGHLGGLVAGVAFGRLIPADKHTPKPAVVLFWRILAGACLAAWAYALFSMWRSIAG